MSVSFLDTDQLLFFPVAVFRLQEEAGSLLVDLSSSLNTISVNQDGGDDGEVAQAATPIVEAASNILNVSSNVRAKLPLLNVFFSPSVLYAPYSTRYMFSSEKSLRFSSYRDKQCSECFAE